MRLRLERTRAFHSLGQGRRMGEGVCRTDQGSRQQIPDARHHSGSCPPAGRERKRGAKTQELGRSRGGLTTKIHMRCDSLGRPLRFMLTAGQRHDNLTAKALLEGFNAEAVLADKAYDNNDLRTTIADMNAEAVIPSTRSRKVPIPHDETIYKLRNRIERCFTSSNTSAASPRDMTDGQTTSLHSSTSPQSAFGSAECGFVLARALLWPVWRRSMGNRSSIEAEFGHQQGCLTCSSSPTARKIPKTKR
ncbi:IS5 family transposase [Bradyrhizobium erythrophlei]|uniref:Transposase n=1 Tax=Bradyrhizobium erythrophlei TaxID=1437360 RepID=A0A1H4Y2M5_9BRAD|nr:Transposase [Bradyrhizobium erythrophlei]